MTAIDLVSRDLDRESVGCSAAAESVEGAAVLKSVYRRSAVPYLELFCLQEQHRLQTPPFYAFQSLNLSIPFILY